MNFVIILVCSTKLFYYYSYIKSYYKKLMLTTCVRVMFTQDIRKGICSRHTS